MRYVTIGLSLIESIAMAVGFGRSGLIKDSAQLSTLHYVVCIIVVELHLQLVQQY